MKKFNVNVEYNVNGVKNLNGSKVKVFVEAKAREAYPQYNFKWEALGGGRYRYVPYMEVSNTEVRKRKGLTYAKKNEVVIKNDNVKFDNNKWRPCIIDDSRRSHDVDYFKEHYLINSDGNVISVDNGDCVVYKPYRHTGNYYHVDFVGNGEHVNQTIRGLLRNSWGENVANAFIALEETGDDLFVA